MAEGAAGASAAVGGACGACGRPGASQRCAGCLRAVYCDAACQRLHWRGGHKRVCRAAASGLVAGDAYPSPLQHAHVVTSTTHKVLRGPRGGIILSNDLELGKKINSAVFPGLQGGPLMHVIAAKAVAFKEALQPSFKHYAHMVVANAQVCHGI